MAPPTLQNLERRHDHLQGPPQNLCNYSLLANGEYYASLFVRGGKVTGGSFVDSDVKDAHRRLCMGGMPRATIEQNIAVCQRAYECNAEFHLTEIGEVA